MTTAPVKQLAARLEAIGFEVAIHEDRVSAAERIDRKAGIGVLSGCFLVIFPVTEGFRVEYGGFGDPLPTKAELDSIEGVVGLAREVWERGQPLAL